MSPFQNLMIFGCCLQTNFHFANRLQSISANQKSVNPTVAFTLTDSAPVTLDWEQLIPAFVSDRIVETGESVLTLYTHKEYDILRFTNIADFYIWPERIIAHSLNPDYTYLLEIRLLGTVLAFWLERRGMLALHTAATVVNSRAVAFLSSNSGGKSSLVASLVQAGFPLLTDDILPVENKNGVFVGRPGYPQMRMWPEQAQHFLGYYETLEIVHPAYSKRRVPVGAGGFGSFCSEAQPLACLYIPERRDPAAHGTAVTITAVPPAQAVIDLVRYSFAPRLVQAAGLQPQRLDFFAELVRQIPIRRLIYPTGYEHLPRVRDAILEDLACL
jgi:hypothetical protein